MLTFPNLVAFSGHTGQSLGETDYVTITQEMVNLFAEATGDHQWIHTDPERAARESPYQTTIAHGFLTLALAPKLMAKLYRIEAVKMGINYGANKIRFTSAVPVGSQLRMQAHLKQIEQHNETTAKVFIECIFAIEGESKPACVAELITLLVE
ncbi:MaoC family dehydratase [Spirosoma jeollabukense]